MSGWLRHRPGGASLRFERPGITGAMGPSMSWDPWPRPVVRTAVGGGRRSVHRLAKTAPRSRFGAFVYTVATRAVTRAASSGTSASTTMACRRRPPSVATSRLVGKPGSARAAPSRGWRLHRGVNPHKPPKSQKATWRHRTGRSVWRAR